MANTPGCISPFHLSDELKEMMFSIPNGIWKFVPNKTGLNKNIMHKNPIKLNRANTKCKFYHVAYFNPSRLFRDSTKETGDAEGERVVDIDRMQKRKIKT